MNVFAFMGALIGKMVESVSFHGLFVDNQAFMTAFMKVVKIIHRQC